MKFGVSIPTCREGMDVPPGYAKPKDVVRLAQTAEKLGFDSIWGNDHMTPSNRIRSLYTQMPNFYEVLITLTYCAAVTERIQLGTGVIVIPFRDPILLAKQVATMDVFSGGRVILGVGLGSNREELEMLYPRQSGVHRGEMMNEALEAMSLLFTESVASFKGKYYEFKDVILEPKPVQKPFPLYMSGRSPNTVERTVKGGSGLMLFSPTTEEVRQSVEELRSKAEERGRDVSEIDVLLSASLSMERTSEEAIRRYQTLHTGRRARVNGDIDVILSRNFIGTPGEIVERIGGLGEAGLKNCTITGIAADTMEERIEQMQMFAEEVMPKLR